MRRLPVPVVLVTAIIGVSLEKMEGRCLSAASDISGEAVGKKVKKDYYRSRRAQRVRDSASGYAVKTVMQFDNLHMSAVVASGFK